MRDHAHADVVMREKKLRSPTVKKSNGKHEFMLAGFLLLGGALLVAYLSSRNQDVKKLLWPTVAASQEGESVYSERDRVYLQKVLEGAKEASGQK